MVPDLEAEDEQVVVYFGVVDVDLQIDAVLEPHLLCQTELYRLLVHGDLWEEVDLGWAGLGLLDEVAEQETEDGTAQGGWLHGVIGRLSTGVQVFNEGLWYCCQFA
jgi:hypothetical protein